MTLKSSATLLALLVLVGLVGWMFGKSGKGAKPTPAVAAVVAPSDREDESTGFSEVLQQRLITRTPLGGYIEPLQVIHLTAQTGGRVAYVAGREGVPVMTGQIVVGLDEERLISDYRAAWSHLSSEMSGIQNAQVQLYNKLYGPTTSPMGGSAYEAYDRTTVPFFNAMRGVVPFMGGPPMQTQTDQQRSFANRSQARSEYERQQATVVASQSRIDAIEAQMRDHRSIAPSSAIILAKHVDVGDTVQPGQKLMDIAQTDRLLLKVEVPARLVSELRTGMIVPVAIDGSLNVDALVDQIFPAANKEQHTVTVKFLLPPDAPIAPGMFASAQLPEPPVSGQAVEVPVIPMSAITYPGSLPSVFVAGRDGRIELRVIRLGERQGDRAVVLSGLKTGEKVVTSPKRNLRSGDPVFGERPQ
ncbi:MAG TPA: efflux RND transporter periplasmic adaptor subunit [Azonexus sp.]|jgi:RND family efflux transporter MFP subunit|nr:efflux RND transporter periplasmic adaptor subunit [Azonexus sp.]